MKKKFRKLSLVLLISAIAIFVFSFVLYHYMTPVGFTTIWQPEPGKPFVTLLFAVWGVMFLFGSVTSLMISKIFFTNEED